MTQIRLITQIEREYNLEEPSTSSNNNNGHNCFFEQSKTLYVQTELTIIINILSASFIPQALFTIFFPILLPVV